VPHAAGVLMMTVDVVHSNQHRVGDFPSTRHLEFCRIGRLESLADSLFGHGDGSLSDGQLCSVGSGSPLNRERKLVAQPLDGALDVLVHSSGITAQLGIERFRACRLRSQSSLIRALGRQQAIEPLPTGRSTLLLTEGTAPDDSLATRG
jgi:hypothetical protein